MASYVRLGNKEARIGRTPTLYVGSARYTWEPKLTSIVVGEAASREVDVARDLAAGVGDRRTSGGHKLSRRQVLPFVGKPLILLAVVLPCNCQEEWRTAEARRERLAQKRAGQSNTLLDLSNDEKEGKESLSPWRGCGGAVMPAAFGFENGEHGRRCGRRVEERWLEGCCC
ncbi:hypothetical protein PIB30_034184 [Stylosanthes scabra]|uniref:Uncharacterized protein n=1 Tax=Stylosanthes scabra TaxID=79078 RepID=A0ABU6QD65_9FABA|nr:hypothetical protein [Stylosanthes scabra]